MCIRDRGTTAPKPNYKPKRILTRAELDDFLTVVEQEEVWRDFFQTELMTGLRRGCLLYTSVEDAGEVHIENDVREIRHQLPTGCSGEGSLGRCV